MKLQTFLAENPRIEALVVRSDITAIRLQHLFRDSDLENYYAMTGFNNSLITEIASPALISVDIFPYGLGENAAKLLLAGPKNLVEQTVVTPHKITERESIPDLGQQLLLTKTSAGGLFAKEVFVQVSSSKKITENVLQVKNTCYSRIIKVTQTLA